MLTQIESKELGMTMWQCRRCQSVEEVAEGHVCPDLAQRKVYIDAQMAKLGDESLPGKERMAAFDAIEKYEKEMHDKDMEELEQKFPRSLYYKVVTDDLRSRLDSAIRYRDKLFAKNDEMRAKGVPYVERQQYLESIKDKAKWNEEHIQELTRALSGGLKLIPYAEWMTVGDADHIRRIGYVKFIQWYGVQFKWCYQVI